MLGVPKPEEESKAPPSPTPQHPLSPMGEACSRMDLTAIHQILVSTHYRDDEGTNEVIKDHCILVLSFPSCGSVSSSVSMLQLSFQEWTQQMRDMLEARKRGDFAFRDKDFTTAIDCYTQVGVFTFLSGLAHCSKKTCM